LYAAGGMTTLAGMKQATGVSADGGVVIGLGSAGPVITWASTSSEREARFHWRGSRSITSTKR
jgi:hypothetical protein